VWLVNLGDVSLKQVSKFFLLVILLAGVLGNFTSVSAAARAPWMSAESAILMEADTGKVLFEKNADRRAYPASMTKMMTCILALENGRPEQMVTIGRDAAYTRDTELHTGYKLRLADLLQEMMLISDNGAAVAVADTIGGSQTEFARLMNAKARAIGAKHTHFVNPNGLPNNRHYSTARDMALIAAYGLKDWSFRDMVSSRLDRVYLAAPVGRSITCENTNELLNSYPGIYGVKTGWTRSAGGCLAAAAERNGVQLIAIVMHSRDGRSRFRDAAALLDYGFNLEEERGKE
jgi:D-alanyl-D-alanine carboxypeptidase (penicillin-binding protein 5/6)